MTILDAFYLDEQLDLTDLDYYYVEMLAAEKESLLVETGRVSRQDALASLHKLLGDRLPHEAPRGYLIWSAIKGRG